MGCKSPTESGCREVEFRFGMPLQNTCEKAKRSIETESEYLHWVECILHVDDRMEHDLFYAVFFIFNENIVFLRVQFGEIK